MKIVQKYGGSSVATTEKIKDIARYIKNNYSPNDRIVIVVSAMGKTTNSLLNLANDISINPNKREQDALISTGEIVSASLLSIALNDIGVPAISLNGKQAGIQTDSFFGRAFIESIEPDRINLELEKGNVVVVTGFQGFDLSGNSTTLGRGGSDTTAVALAAVLSCPCEIYTDVDAVYSVDPRIYNSKPLHEISYEEMMEMSIHGVKVLETRCIELAKKYNVPLYLGKTLENNKEKGTYVMNKPSSYFEQMIINSLSVKDNYFVCTVKLNNYKNLDLILNLISKSGLNLEMVSEIDYENKIYFSFGSSSNEIVKLYKDIQLLKDTYCLLKNNFTKITISGTGFSTHTNAISSIFKTLSDNDIKYEKISITEMSASILISEKDKNRAVNLLSSKFNL